MFGESQLGQDKDRQAGTGQARYVLPLNVHPFLAIQNSSR